MRKHLLLASFAAGLLAILGQSLIIRELVIAFLGNELVIGVALGAWLFWTGVGSAVLGRLGERSERPRVWLACELVTLAVLLPACFVAAARVRQFTGLDEGEIAGPLTVIAACFGVLLPLCLVNGSLFPAVCRALSRELARGRAIARAYVWEAIGSAVGGILFTAALVRLGEPLYALAACSLGALAGACVLWHKRAAAVGVLVLIVLIPLTALWVRPSRPEHLNTIYGRTSVRTRRGTVAVFHNGALSWTHPAAGTAEPLVHLALLQLDEPRRVLLIGGLGGAAEAALGHPNVQLDIVELDPAAAAFVRRVKPPSPLDGALASGRARLLFDDARRYVAHYQGPSYDALVLDLPAPVTAQVNRYYTAEFYADARRILAPEGVLAFRVESAPNLSTPELRDFIARLKRTLETAFPMVVVAPGDSNVFVASPRPAALTLNPDALLDRLYARNIRTQVFDATVRGDLNPFKVEELEQILAESPVARVNRDLHPISYAQGLAVWSAKERTPRSAFAEAVIERPMAGLRWLSARAPRWRAAAAAAVVILAGGVLMVVRPRRRRAVGLAVACSGFAEITVEILALLAFQALYGYVYAMLGLILAGFMIGLCAGGACASRILRSRSQPFRWLLGTQWALVAYPLLLLAVILGVKESGAPDAVVAAAFLVLTFVAGLVGGTQFPLAAAVAGGESRRVAAALSALDLCGAALGAVAVSAFLLPTLGFADVAVLVACIGVIPLVGLVAARREPAA